MKPLKIIVALVGVLLLAFVAIGMIAPKESVVERSIVIDADAKTVWTQISSLENQAVWSPWAEKDPDMEVEYTGTPGTIGSTYSWKSDVEDVGNGIQSIEAIEPLKRMEQKLTFTSPQESEANVIFTLTPSGQSQLVSWTVKSTFNFTTSVFFMLFLDMEEMIGPTFEHGLANLKELCESTPPDMSEMEVQNHDIDGIEITEKQFDGQHYVGIRKKIKMEEISAFFAENYGQLFSQLGDAGYVITGMPSAIYYEWDEEAGMADVAAVAPVDGETSMDGFESFFIPPSACLQTVHTGPYDAVGPTHGALNKFCVDHDYVAELAIEEYMNDPGEVSPEELQTKITYPFILK